MCQHMEFIDLQVNGCYGVDFNGDELSPDQLHHVCEVLESDSLAGILATIITDDIERMSARLARIADLRESDTLARKIIWGIHVEGPFINPAPGYVGAHPPQHVRAGRSRRHEMHCSTRHGDSCGWSRWRRNVIPA